jgi:hypothetical protein
MHIAQYRFIGADHRRRILKYVHGVGEAFGRQAHHQAQSVRAQIHRLAQNSRVKMQQFRLVVGGPAKNLCTEMGLGIDRHDDVGKLNSGVGAIQFAAHALQLGGRALCREPPHLDLGAIKLEIPALHGLTHAFEADSISSTNSLIIVLTG